MSLLDVICRLDLAQKLTYRLEGKLKKKTS
jgi:hypothetical protein